MTLSEKDLEEIKSMSDSEVGAAVNVVLRQVLGGHEDRREFLDALRAERQVRLKR